jgi:hypothetical protein
VSAVAPDWAELLDRLMPFHLRIDRMLRITRVGSLLQRVAPALQIGNPLLDQMEMRPSMPNATFASITSQLAGRLTILRMEQPLFQIRGCFVELPGNEELLFAGSLWVTELDALTELGLAGSMLPPNEPLIDLLMTHRLMMTAQQSSQRAQTSAREAEARRQIETLEEVNRRLDAAVRERTTELERINSELTQLLRSLPR